MLKILGLQVKGPQSYQLSKLEVSRKSLPSGPGRERYSALPSIIVIPWIPQYFKKIWLTYVQMAYDLSVIGLVYFEFLSRLVSVRWSWPLLVLLLGQHRVAAVKARLQLLFGLMGCKKLISKSWPCFLFFTNKMRKKQIQQTGCFFECFFGKTEYKFFILHCNFSNPALNQLLSF